MTTHRQPDIQQRQAAHPKCTLRQMTTHRQPDIQQRQAAHPTCTLCDNHTGWGWLPVKLTAQSQLFVDSSSPNSGQR